MTPMMTSSNIMIQHIFYLKLEVPFCSFYEVPYRFLVFENLHLYGCEPHQSQALLSAAYLPVNGLEEPVPTSFPGIISYSISDIFYLL